MVYLVKATVAAGWISSGHRMFYREVDVEVFVEADVPETSQEAELLYEVFKEACKEKVFIPNPQDDRAVVNIKSVTRL